RRKWAEHYERLRRKPSPRFEDRVFLHLERHKRALGITEVYRFRGYRADGALRLRGGSLIALEIKPGLSWQSACQAQWQLERCIFYCGSECRWTGGLVVFERFRRDWGKLRSVGHENRWER